MGRFYGAIPLLLIASLLLSTGNAKDSVYTDFDTARCDKLSGADEEGGVSLVCKGFNGLPVYFDEGDLRESVLYGTVNDAYVDGAFESFEPFNHAGSKIEWRLSDEGKPFAAIQRWFISNADPSTGEPKPSLIGQVLVVSKIAAKDGKGCVVGYVDALANSDPNSLAREIADTKARDFACGRDTAEFSGTRGPLAADPTHDFPEE